MHLADAQLHWHSSILHNALLEDAHSVAALLRFTHIMRRKEDRSLILFTVSLDQFQHPPSALSLNPAGHLIEVQILGES